MIDPFTLPAPDEKLETRTFEENGHSLKITFSGRVSYARNLLIDEKVEFYKAKYITGLDEKGDDGKTYKVVTPIRQVGTLIPRASANLCTAIAHIEAMQITEGADAPLTFDQWAAYGELMPDSMNKIVNWALSLRWGSDNDLKGETLKNGSGADAAP